MNSIASSARPLTQIDHLYQAGCWARGNAFVLGAIRLPPEALTLDYAIKHLGLWFWLAATVSFAYVDITKRLDHSYGDEYLRVAARAKVVAKDLVHEYNNALDRLASFVMGTPNKSLDASGDSVFLNWLDSAKGALIRAAAPTQPLCFPSLSRDENAGLI